MDLSILPPGVEPANLSPFPEYGDAPFQQRGFDAQAHRGGRGLHTEESLQGFARSIELGVSTLEMDIGITKDHVPVIWHDEFIMAEKCEDTAPIYPNDPAYPYVGKHIRDLTYNQILSLNCGFKQLEGFPEQQVVWGNRIAALPEVFDLAKAYNATDLWYDIETKLNPVDTNSTFGPQLFVDVILDAIFRAGVEDRVMIESFDWRSLPLVHERAPSIPLVALADRTTLYINESGASPWFGGLDIDDYDGDLNAVAAALGANIISPDYNGSEDKDEAKSYGDDGFEFFTDRAFIDRAHELGLLVVPWTVEDRDTMAALVELGVDGIITDYPNVLRQVLVDLGVEVAHGYPRPRSVVLQPISEPISEAQDALLANWP